MLRMRGSAGLTRSPTLPLVRPQPGEDSPGDERVDEPVEHRLQGRACGTLVPDEILHQHHVNDRADDEDENRGKQNRDPQRHDMDHLTLLWLTGQDSRLKRLRYRNLGTRRAVERVVDSVEKETGRVEAFSDGVFAIAITLL